MSIYVIPDPTPEKKKKNTGPIYVLYVYAYKCLHV